MISYTEPRMSSMALLTIDVQRDFISEKFPGKDEKKKVLPFISRVTRAFRISGRPIIHIVRIYQRDGSNADLCRRAKIENGEVFLSPGSDGVQIIEQILPSHETRLDEQLLLQGNIQTVSPREFIVYKPRFGAFYQTPLSSLLGDLGIDSLAIGGFNFPNCPRASIYEASERDYRIVALEDGISHLYPKGKEELENIGVVFTNSEDLIKAIRDKNKERK